MGTTGVTRRLRLWPGGWRDHALPDGNAELATTTTLDREKGYLKRVARAYAPRDPLLADDLAQAARITLWDVDASRFAADDDGYLKRLLMFAVRMARRSAMRAEGGMRRESLTVTAICDGDDTSDDDAPTSGHRPFSVIGGVCDNDGLRAIYDRRHGLQECMDWLANRDTTT
jgi:hypothetical protein